MPPPPRGREVMAGTGLVTAFPMIDSSELWTTGQTAELRRRFAQDGYVLIRGLLNRDSVEDARAAALEELAALRPELFAAGEPPHLGLTTPGATNLGLLGFQHVAHGSRVQPVLEAAALWQLARTLSGADAVITTGYKWLRGVARGEFTGLHTDRVFLGRGSDRLLTIWLPLGDVPAHHGGLLVCHGSHRLRAFAPLRASYGASTVGEDGTRSGWMSSDGSTLGPCVGKYAADWRTVDYRAGDVVALSIDLFHMSAANCTDCIRVSCDTRWQPEADERDPRLAVWRRKGGEGGVSVCTSNGSLG